MYQSRSIVKLTIIAVSLSVLLHVGFVVYSIYQKMGGWDSYQSQTMVQKVTPVEFILPEDMPEQIQDPLQPQNNEPVTNQAFNAEDKREHSDQKYDSRTEKEIEAEVERELREFEANEFSKYKKDKKQEVSIQKEEKTDAEKGKDGEEKKSSSGSLKGNVTALYELTQRRDEKLAIPAYLCKGSGTVKVNVVVDREGLVIEAVIDKKGSNYKESCIGERSLEYARKCRFSVSTVAPEMQTGWILYTFIPQ